jgi:hypothetical protein
MEEFARSAEGGDRRTADVIDIAILRCTMQVIEPPKIRQKAVLFITSNTGSGLRRRPLDGASV